jgi:hypothetical protein
MAAWRTHGNLVDRESWVDGPTPRSIEDGVDPDGPDQEDHVGAD